MKKFIINDLSEVAESMYFDITEDNYSDVMFAGYYEDAIVVLKHLLMFDNTVPCHIDIADDGDFYDKEYFVTLNSDMGVWCTRAYDNHICSCYLPTETECLYIADDCNSVLLKYINCSKDEMYEVSYNLDDECECGNNCDCSCTSTEKDSHEVVTRVATDGNGKIKGFEKSWETFEDGLYYRTTYSFYSSNEDMLNNILDNFDIKY